MLVPLMTIEEIRREINKDFPIVFRKMGYVAQKLKKNSCNSLIITPNTKIIGNYSAQRVFKQ